MIKFSLEKIIDIYRLLCYRWLKDKIKPLSEKFEFLKYDLKSASLNYLLEEYLSVALMSSIITSLLLSYFTSLTLYYLLDIENQILLLILYFALEIFYFGLFFLMFIVFVFYKKKSIQKEIDHFLPDAIMHLSTLSTTGLPYFKMFKIMSLIDEYGEVSKVFKRIATNVEVYGMDFLETLKEEADKTPSTHLKEVFYGILTVIKSGGDMSTFLLNKSHDLMRLKEQKEKEYVDTLSMVAELYVTVLIAGPLMAIIILSVIGLISNLPIRYDLLLTMIVYIGIPIAYLAFIIILSTK